MASASISSGMSGHSRHSRQSAAASATEQAGTPATDNDSEFDPVADWDTLSLPPRDSESDSWEHVYENGRRYHKYREGRYPLPNDETEQSRDDLKHALMLELMDGRLYYAPLADDVEKIIDVGTGTGIWAIEMGDMFPDAQVLGIDLSPIQPSHIPPNVRFLIDDCEAEWANGAGWDFAHFRQMTATLIDVPRVINQTFQHLKPGGWIEFQELYGVPLCDDGTMTDDDPLHRFCTLVNDSLDTREMSMDRCRALRGPLTRAGFVNIRLIKKKIPIGEWPQDQKLQYIGRLERLALVHVIPAVTGKMFEDLGISRLEREVWAATVKRSIEDPTVHRYFYEYFWYAQKPSAT